MKEKKNGNPLINKILDTRKTSDIPLQAKNVYNLSAVGLLMVTLIATIVMKFIKEDVMLGIVLALAVGSQIGLVLYLASNPLAGKKIYIPYILSQGLIFGAIAKTFQEYTSPLLTAFILTVGVFLGTYFLFNSNIVKVTSKFKSIVFTMTTAAFFVYLFSFIFALIGIPIGFVSDGSSPWYLIFHILMLTIASLNFFVDFDNIKKAEEEKQSKEYEYALSVSLMATTLWVYLEILRIVANNK